MQLTEYRVVTAHTSEYPEPIQFEAGAPLTLGEVYEGPEDWQDWRFCHTPGQAGGWVPQQIIEVIAGDRGRAREDYSARELEVVVGERVLAGRQLNGWAWCRRSSGDASGWVPLENLQAEGAAR